MVFVAFIPRPLQTGSTWPQILHSLYWGLSKPIFILGIILVILPSTLGLTYSFFNTILTPKIFHFIARISFCTYLVHLMFISQFMLTRSYDTYFKTIDIFIINMGILILSLIFGFLLMIVVELPFANLQKELMNYLTKGTTLDKKRKVKESLLSTESLENNKKDGLTTAAEDD